MTVESTARVQWRGSLKDGHGQLTVASGAFQARDITWSARAAKQAGKTSPEELLAAAEASCLAMKLSSLLTQQGHTPERLDIEAIATFNPDSGVEGINLMVRGVVPGTNEETFREAVQEAARTCPISRALAIPTPVEASLETPAGTPTS